MSEDFCGGTVNEFKGTLGEFTIDEFCEQGVVAGREEAFEVGEHAARLLAAAAQDADFYTGLKDEIKSGGECAQEGFSASPVGEEDGVSLGGEGGGVWGEDGEVKREGVGRGRCMLIWGGGGLRWEVACEVGVVVCEEGTGDVIKWSGVAGEEWGGGKIQAQVGADPGVEERGCGGAGCEIRGWG